MGSILLVESEPEVRERLARALAVDGHDLLSAITAGEAFSRASEGGIDVIVLDAYDPVIGVELARNLRALPDAPPVLLVSASPSAPELSARIGASAFLPKPFEMAELVALIARHVQSRPVRVPDDFNDFADDEPTGPSNLL